MNIVNRLIYSRLAAGQNVELPDVGILRVSQTEARVISGKVLAPQRSVEFVGGVTGGESIVEAIAREGEISAGDAQHVYESWRSEFVHGGDVDFGEAGKVTDGIFYPAAALTDALNPFGARGDKMKKNSMEESVSRGRKCCGFWTWFFGIIAVLAIVLSILLATGRWNSVKRWVCGEKTEQIVAPTQMPVAEEPQEVTPAEVEPATTNDAVSPTPAKATVKYYLIGGVFSVASNADRLIRENKFYSTTYERFEYKGKTAVSIFSSTSLGAVKQRKFELEDIDREIWILKQ